MSTLSLLGHAYTVAQIYGFVAAYIVPVVAGWFSSHAADWLKTNFLLSEIPDRRTWAIRGFTLLICLAFALADALVTKQPIGLHMVWDMAVAYGVAIVHYDHALKS